MHEDHEDIAPSAVIPAKAGIYLPVADNGIFTTEAQSIHRGTDPSCPRRRASGSLSYYMI